MDRRLGGQTARTLQIKRNNFFALSVFQSIHKFRSIENINSFRFVFGKYRIRETVFMGPAAINKHISCETIDNPVCVPGCPHQRHIIIRTFGFGSYSYLIQLSLTTPFWSGRSVRDDEARHQVQKQQRHGVYSAS